MSHPATPRIAPTPLADLRPAQPCIGFREMEAKRSAFREKAKKDRFLGDHQIPCVRGPKGRLYVLDHHHEGRALELEGVTSVFVSIVDDVSAMSKAEWWRYAVARGYCRLFDEHGEALDWREMPRTLADLRDDPYRSLAGEARRAGAIAKSAAPFSEFLVADHLRSRIDQGAATGEPKSALKLACRLLKSKDAAYLPGWAGPE